MTVRIVTDSACDLRGDEVDQLGIEVVPLSIRFGETEYIDREELSVEQFYTQLADSETLPETSAPAPGRFDQAFRRQLDAGASEIVCINLSAALSATMQSAKTAAAGINADIRVIDSRSITVGLGSIVIAAAEMAANGATPEQIETAVADLSRRTQVYAALDTLEYLKKGGRVGSAQALLASMLAIKPILNLSSGEVQEASKQRTRKKSLLWLRDKLSEYEKPKNVAIMHSQAPDLKRFLRMIGKIVDVEDARIEVIGPVVGTHGGPGVIGFALQS